jgi:hypothetical protein
MARVKTISNVALQRDQEKLETGISDPEIVTQPDR